MLEKVQLTIIVLMIVGAIPAFWSTFLIRSRAKTILLSLAYFCAVLIIVALMFMIILLINLGL